MSQAVGRAGALPARWLPILLAAVALPVAGLTTAGTLTWTGRPFPGFFVMENGVVPTVGLYDWSGLQAGVPFHARVTAIDGHPFTTQRAFYDAVAERPIGTLFHYVLKKDGRTLERTVPSMRFGRRDYWLTVGLFVLNGVLGLAAGLGVGLLRPRDPAARAFLLFGFCWGLFPLTGTALYSPDLAWLSRLHYVAQAAFPATFIHLGLVFPVERPLVHRSWIWLVLPYVASAAITVWILRDFYASPPSTTPLHAAYLYSAFSILTLIALLGLGWWEGSPLARRRVLVLLPGLVLGGATALYGFLNTANGGGDFPINLIAVTPVVFFLSVAFAIVRHDLFGIDVFLRQTAVYVTLTLGITALYAATLVALGLVVPAQAVQASPVFHIGFVVLVAFLFQPLRARVQDGLDRIFHRNRLDYRRTVTEVSAALTSLLDLREILGRVGSAVYDGLQLRSAAVVLWLDAGPRLWRYDASEQRMREERGPRPFAGVHSRLTATRGQPWTVPQAEDADADTLEAPLRADVAALDAVLFVPVALGERLIGAFALGRKRSGLPFDREEYDLLRTLTAQTAIAAQNAISYQALLELNAALEERVAHRTRELTRSNDDLGRAYEELQAAQAQLLQTEKLAALGQLVAGVAHEINNPVSFIVGNVEPLRSKLAALQTVAAQHGIPEVERLAERVRRLFDIMARGAERTAGIVADLRVFSRVGEEAPQPTDLDESISVSLRLLRPRWNGRIAVHREFGDVPPVEVVPGQLNQVLLNLLANACDAIPETGNLWVRTAREGNRVVVSVRDDGAGIEPAHLPRIFDPFFTTKAQGKGTGLGLAISHGIVAQHGGTIEVKSEPGRGTEFVVALPLRATPSARHAAAT